MKQSTDRYLKFRKSLVASRRSKGHAFRKSQADVLRTWRKNSGKRGVP